MILRNSSLTEWFFALRTFIHSVSLQCVLLYVSSLPQMCSMAEWFATFWTIVWLLSSVRLKVSPHNIDTTKCFVALCTLFANFFPVWIDKWVLRWTKAVITFLCKKRRSNYPTEPTEYEFTLGKKCKICAQCNKTFGCEVLWGDTFRRTLERSQTFVQNVANNSVMLHIWGSENTQQKTHTGKKVSAVQQIILSNWSNERSHYDAHWGQVNLHKVKFSKFERYIARDLWVDHRGFTVGCENRWLFVNI